MVFVALPGTMSSSNNEQKCKICDETYGELYKPCECDYVAHKKCIGSMVSVRYKNTMTDNYNCAVCQTELKYSYNKNFETQEEYWTDYNVTMESQNVYNASYDNVFVRVMWWIHGLYLVSAITIMPLLISYIVLGTSDTAIINKRDGIQNTIAPIIILLMSLIFVCGVMTACSKDADMESNEIVKYAQHMILILVHLLSCAQICGLFIINIIEHGNMFNNLLITPLTCLIGLGFLLVIGIITFLINCVVMHKLILNEKNKITIASIETV
jgi:hypothetical protein